MKLKFEKRTAEIVREIEGEKVIFKVSILNPKEINKLLDASVRHEWDRNQRFDKIDYYKFTIDKLDKMVVDWEGLEDVNGVALECNRANKEVVYLYYSSMIDSVLEEAEQLCKEAAVETEALEKN